MRAEWIKGLARALVPPRGRRWLRRWTVSPPVGRVDFGDLRRTEPLSRKFGFERGQPVDRYYIEQFLEKHRADIRGHTLEIGDDLYTRKFGAGQVTRAEVLHAQAGNPKATLVADLTRTEQLPAAAFDCIVFTQTLPFIYDTRAALCSLARLLKPRGVLLATVPGISHISRYDMDRWGDFWRFNSRSVQQLFSEAFPSAQMEVGARGNVLAAIALLHGLAVEDLCPEELERDDRDYEVLITVRVAAPGGG